MRGDIRELIQFTVDAGHILRHASEVLTFGFRRLACLNRVGDINDVSYDAVNLVLGISQGLVDEVEKAFDRLSITSPVPNCSNACLRWI